MSSTIFKIDKQISSVAGFRDKKKSYFALIVVDFLNAHSHLSTLLSHSVTLGHGVHTPPHEKDDKSIN